MKSIRIVGEVVQLSRMSLMSVSAPLKDGVEVEQDVRGIFAVVVAPPTPMDEGLLEVRQLCRANRS